MLKTRLAHRHLAQRMAVRGPGAGHGTGASGSPYHAVISTGNGGSFGYDAAGNMSSRRLSTGGATQTLAWTPANELRWVAVGGVTQESYRYDPAGERLTRSVANGPTQTTYFPGYEVSVQGGVTTVTKSYFFNGAAHRPEGGGGCADLPARRPPGQHGAGDGAGAAQRHERERAARSTTPTAHTRERTRVPSEWQYTGQEQDGTGLVYLHARYYDPATGPVPQPRHDCAGA